MIDPATDRMVVFGGSWATTPLNDTWVLINADGLGGTPAWTQLSPTGGPPATRTEHSAVYGVANARMIVFGGDKHIGSCDGPVNDVWVLANADGLGGTPAWTQLSPTGPGPVALLSGATAIYSATGVVVYGTASSLVNTATVSSGTYDPVSSNNSSTVNTPVDVDLVFKDGFEGPP